MKFQIIPVTPFQQNCTLMWDETTNKAAVVDPGGDIDKISEALKQRNLTLEKVFVTHGHLDHCGGARKLADLYNVPIEGPNKEDAWLLEQLNSDQTRMWGLPPGDPFTPDRWLNQGDEVTVGNETLQVFHCPGHSPGHVIFFHAPTKVAISGDVLFCRFNRTNRSSQRQLQGSGEIHPGKHVQTGRRCPVHPRTRSRFIHRPGTAGQRLCKR